MASSEVMRDAISVMKKGGLHIADEARDKWWAGQYGRNEEQIQERIRHWKAVSEAVKAMCSELAKTQQ